MIEARVREARDGDLAACAAIVNDWVDATPWHKRVVSREDVEAMFVPALLESRTVLVAVDEGEQVLGYLSLDEPERFVRGLYLAPTARGRGTGKRLIDEAKARCPDRLELGTFEPNRGAIRFYGREGFREVPEGRKADTPEGVPELLMRWEPR